MGSKSHKGESNPRSKLTDAKVREIREALTKGMDVKKLSLIYNVGMVTIYKIKSGERWGHVK